MNKLKVSLFLALITLLALNSPSGAWTNGRVVVLGTEFFWYNPTTGTVQPLRLVGYSDYDLLTATTVNWEEDNLCSRTGIRNIDQKIDINFDLIVDPGLYGAVLDKLRFNDAMQTPRDVNLLRIWANGKHNARSWLREQGIEGHDPVRANDLRNEHDFEAFNSSSGKYDIVGPLNPNYVDRLQQLCRTAKAKNIVVMLTIFDNITLIKNGGPSTNEYRWGTSPWFYGNQAGATLQMALPEDGFGTTGYGSSSGDAYPRWYFNCFLNQSCDFGPSQLGPLVNTQWHFMQQLIKAVTNEDPELDCGNVIFEIMNEPDPINTTQADNMLWHEIMGLLLHSLDPTRIVVANPTLQPDTSGSFRIGTNGCTDFSFPECQPVGINSVGHRLLDLPDLDAISLHFDQWGVNDTDETETTAMMENVLDRTPAPGQELLFTTNIKPVIVDTDGATTTDDSNCGEPAPTCSDPRIVNLNDKLATFANKAIDLGASFNHKDGIGTTELSGPDKCGIGDARTPLTTANLNSRIDDGALTKLNAAHGRFDPAVAFNQNHEPDYAVVDLRYDDDCVNFEDYKNCIETYSAAQAEVPLKISLGRLSTVAPAHLELQYRWLRATPSTSQILSVWEQAPGQPFPWTYLTDVPLPTVPVPYYVMDVPYQTPAIPAELLNAPYTPVVVFEVRITTWPNGTVEYDRDQLLLWKAAGGALPGVTAPDPGQVAAGLEPLSHGNPPIIDPGSLHATVAGSTATLSWTLYDPVGDALVNLSVDTTPASDMMVATGLTESSYQISDLAPGTTYYWWIAAADTRRHVDESAVQSFTTTGPHLNQVILTRPEPGSSNVSPTTILEWNIVDPEPELLYSVYFDECPGGSCPSPPTSLICSNVTGTTCNPPTSDPGSPPCIPAQLDDNTQYIWRVVAHGSPSTEAIGTFTTGARQVEHEFTLTSPLNGFTVPWDDVRVVWREDSSCFDWDATRIVYRNEANIGQIWNVLNHPQTSGCFFGKPPKGQQFYCKDLPDLQPDAAYQWGVFCCCNPNFSTCTGTWSEIGRFTTDGPTISPPPQLSQPSNGALLPVLEGDTIQFSWTASTASPPGTPVTYRLEIAIDSVPPTPVAVFSNLGSTSKTIPASVLAEDDVYTWKVTATAGSTSIVSIPRTLVIDHTDEWVVVTPGYGATSGANIASIFYNPDPDNPMPTLSLIRQFEVGERSGSGELLPAVGDVDSANPGKELVFGSGIAGSNKVYIYGTAGVLLGSFTAFNSVENPSGRVHVAIGDADSSNAGNEIIVGSGPDYSRGVSTRVNPTPMGIVKIFRPDGTLLQSFTANPTGGLQADVWVAAGDLYATEPGDEIVCGLANDLERVVQVYRGDGSQILSIPTGGGGFATTLDMTVAVGDFSPTNAGTEVLVGSGFNNYPNEVVLLSQSGTVLTDPALSVFNEAENPFGSVRVAAGYIDGEVGLEILAGTVMRGEGLLKILKSNGTQVLQQQVLPPSVYGGEVHVAGNQ